jgi:hypothetical protein
LNTLKATLLAGVVNALLVSMTAYAQQPSLPTASPAVAAFQDGLADRQKWEDWFATLSGDTKTGAEYWAGQRSLPHPGSCYAAAGQSLGDFTVGCMEAQDRLGPTDARRKNEPTYKDGWNAWTPTSTPRVVAAPQALSAPPVAAQPPAQPFPVTAPPPASSTTVQLRRDAGGTYQIAASLNGDQPVNLHSRHWRFGRLDP